MAEQQQSQSHTGKNIANKDKGPVPPTHVVIDPPLPAITASQPEPANAQPQAPEKPLPQWKRPEWVIVYITAAYVLVSLLTLLVIKRQADIMQQQADDARASAASAAEAAAEHVKATKLNAESLINAERAWLSVKVGEIFMGEMDIRYVRVPIRNSGRTSAKVGRMVVTSKLIPFPEHGWGRPGELPKTFTLGDSNHTMVVEGKDFIIPPGSDHMMYALMFNDEWKKIKDRAVSLYVYGYVEYLDTVEWKEHKTCFCEIYWVPEKTSAAIEEFRFVPLLIPPDYICAT